MRSAETRERRARKSGAFGRSSFATAPSGADGGPSSRLGGAPDFFVEFMMAVVFKEIQVRTSRNNFRGRHALRPIMGKARR
jgi:hypothetical protein